MSKQTILLLKKIAENLFLRKNDLYLPLQVWNKGARTVVPTLKELNNVD